jgi:hypothetical protein
MLRKTYGFGFFWVAGFSQRYQCVAKVPFIFSACSDDAPACNYTVNGHECIMGYYLADDIYSEWATLVKTI